MIYMREICNFSCFCVLLLVHLSCYLGKIYTETLMVIKSTQCFKNVHQKVQFRSLSLTKGKPQIVQLENDDAL